MSAHFFTGWTSQFGAGGFRDSCVGRLIHGASLERARARFQEWLLQVRQGDPPADPKIEKIVAAPVLEHLFTEQGPVPIDWAQMCEEAARAAEAGSEDAFEQGCWADCDGLVDPDHLSPDLEALRNGLPEEVRSGLNWSVDKQYYQIVSVLSPPPAPQEEPDFEEPSPEDLLGSGEGASDPEVLHREERVSDFPEMANKEAAVVVRARNSVVAAWLWRRAAGATGLARNRIRVDPWCGAEGLESQPS